MQFSAAFFGTGHRIEHVRGDSATVAALIAICFCIFFRRGHHVQHVRGDNATVTLIFGAVGDVSQRVRFQLMRLRHSWLEQSSFADEHFCISQPFVVDDLMIVFASRC